MLKEKDLILATRKYAKEDRAKSWRSLIITTLLLLVAYAGALVNSHIILQIVCSLLAGLLLVRLFIIYHDYLHHTLLQRSPLAKAFFTLFGMFILAPVSIWKRSHDYHHEHNSKLYTASIGSYPLVTKKDFLKANKAERRIYLFTRHPLTIFFGYFSMFIYGMCIQSLMKNPKRHRDSLYALIFHAAIGFTVWWFFGWQGFLLGFFLPSFLSNAIGAYLFYAQHNFPGVIHKNKKEWDYVFAALHSSSYMKMSRLMHWFTGNIGYHHIHHVNPRIPFYNLPKVYKEVDLLQNPGTTSLHPAEVYRCLQLKVWDPEEGRMLRLKEVQAS